MSSKGAGVANQRSGLAPTLRFPEFQGTGDWDQKTLAAVCEMKAGKFVSATDISDKFEVGLYPCFGGNGLRGYTKTFTHIGKFPLIGRQGALCGNVNLGSGSFYATEHAVVVKARGSAAVDWLYHLLVHYNLNQFKSGQAQPGLSVEVLDKLPCAVPTAQAEQQKIADCLSSIDALIAADADKLEALKDHKKGLMQQLFPAPGETTPRLRFPEFEDAGEWEVQPLGGLLQCPPTYGANAAATPYDPSLPTYLRITDISDDGRFIHENKTSVNIKANAANSMQPGDIALTRTGASVGKAYLHTDANGPLVFAGFLIRVRPNSRLVLPEIIFQFLSTQNYWLWVEKTSTRSGQPGINSLYQ